jgi:hypothetical protein
MVDVDVILLRFSRVSGAVSTSPAFGPAHRHAVAPAAAPEETVARRQDTLGARPPDSEAAATCVLRQSGLGSARSKNMAAGHERP